MLNTQSSLEGRELQRELWTPWSCSRLRSWTVCTATIAEKSTTSPPELKRQKTGKSLEDNADNQLDEENLLDDDYDVIGQN